MQLHTKAVLIALFLSAVRVHAYNITHEHDCVKAANDNCAGPGLEDSQPWKITYARCISVYWRSLPTDGNCPHREIGCHCYQGCVQDRYIDYPDVGKYCVETCTQANLPATDC
ncbi:hypothetical protein V8E36_002228 [Tilletia maclaganii]